MFSPRAGLIVGVCVAKPDLGRPICLITPPIGLNCFVVAGVARELRGPHGESLAIPLQDVFRGIGPFFVADVLTVAVLLALPEVVLWLPRTMG